MSGECDECGEHTLDCLCKGGIGPPGEEIPVKWVNVNGREEHEAILKDPEKCKELGLDQYFEIMVYLKRWGGWLTPSE